MYEKTDIKLNAVFDKAKTAEYYKNQQLCDCIGCRNFYVQIKSELPSLNDFLKDFGVDIEKPDEIEWLKNKHNINYIMAGYTVCGTLSENKENHIVIKDKQSIDVIIRNGVYSFPNLQKENYFEIIVSGFQLSYILSEPID